MVSVGSPPPPAPDGAVRRLVDALASVPGVPGQVAGLAHRLRADPRGGEPWPDELARRLLAGLDRDVLAARWVERVAGPSGEVRPDRTGVDGAGDAALAAGAVAVADLLHELSTPASPHGEPHTLVARSRAREADGTPVGWTYEARAPDGSTRVVRVADAGCNAPLAAGDTVLFHRLRPAPSGPTTAGAASHVAGGAVGLPSAAELAMGSAAASRRLILALVLSVPGATPFGALVASVHRAAAGDADADPVEELARRLRDGALRAAGPAGRRAGGADARTVAAARRYLARLAGEPRADALADAAAAFPALPPAVLATLGPDGAGEARDVVRDPPLPSGP